MSEKKSGRGVRYSPEQKQEVLDFVKANPGHGSMKQAQEKFGVSYVAIRNWLEDSGQVFKKREKKIRGERKVKAVKIPKVDNSRFDKAIKLIGKVRDAEEELRGLYVQLNSLLQP